MTSALETHRLALSKSPPSNNTRRSYESWVGGYLAWLDAADVDGDRLSDPSARDWVVRDYRSWLKNAHNCGAFAATYSFGYNLST